MRKILINLLLAGCILLLFGCAQKAAVPEVINTIEGNLKTYYEMSDGTWQTEENSYQYKLEIIGRMNNAVKDSTFVYLSNREEITFDQAWKAAGLSSNQKDYFSPEEAVLVEWN